MEGVVEVPRVKTPKFKRGDPVYIKKPDLILFGEIRDVRGLQVVRWNQTRISRRMKFKYIVKLEFPHYDGRFKGRKFARPKDYIVVAESSLRLLVDEKEVINNFMKAW